MRFDRADRNVVLAGDGLIHPPTSDAEHDLLLSGREFRPAIEHFREIGQAHLHAALRFERFGDSLRQLASVHGLHEKVRRTGVQRLHGHFNVAVPREKEHGLRILSAAQFRKEFEPRHIGHAYVENDATRHRGHVVAKEVCRARIGLHVVAFATKHEAESFERRRVVIHHPHEKMHVTHGSFPPRSLRSSLPSRRRPPGTAESSGRPGRAVRTSTSPDISPEANASR